MQFANKYLSIFTERLIPRWLIQKYPNLVFFIQYFLEYLEVNQDLGTGQSDEAIYRKISNLVDYKTIDYIISLSNSELQEQLLNKIFYELTGDENTRHLSSMLDEALYIDHHTDFNKYKGTKASFQILFLLVLGGTIEFEYIRNIDKKHDGTWQYNGLITYDGSGNENSGFNPFVYKVITNLTPASYINILDKFNPAGFQYYISNYFEKAYPFGATGTDIVINEDYKILRQYAEEFDQIEHPKFDHSKIYATLYCGNEFAIMIRPALIKYYKETNDTGAIILDNYHFERHDYVTKEDDNPLIDLQNGNADWLYSRINVNSNMFAGTTSNVITTIKFVYNPSDTANYYYNTPQVNGGETMLIINNLDIVAENNIDINTCIQFDYVMNAMMQVGWDYEIQ